MNASRLNLLRRAANTSACTCTGLQECAVCLVLNLIDAYEQQAVELEELRGVCHDAREESLMYARGVQDGRQNLAEVEAERKRLAEAVDRLLVENERLAQRAVELELSGIPAPQQPLETSNHVVTFTTTDTTAPLPRCRYCGGTGWQVKDAYPCPACHGRGGGS